MAFRMTLRFIGLALVLGLHRFGYGGDTVNAVRLVILGLILLSFVFEFRRRKPVRHRFRAAASCLATRDVCGGVRCLR